MKASILIADDQPDVLEALALLFGADETEIVQAGSPSEVIRLVGARDFDLVLIDMNYTRDTSSGAEGLDLLEQLHGYDPTLPIVVMTAWASIQLVVEAMQKGARDFVQKPWDNARLRAIVRNQVELGRALRRSQRLENENSILRGDGATQIVAESPSMRRVLEVVQRVAPSDANVLVRGENGTGKGLIARALHASSKRAAKAIISVNIGGLSDSLFESELFGHVKGAFTDARQDRMGRFELADGGTLFLDEIANIGMSQQAKLLRVIESGEFERVGSSQTRRADVRLISATNALLEQEVQGGRFRQDLLFRLNTVQITIPPLRERREDIPPLASQFLGRFAKRYRKDINGFQAAAMKAMLEHPWSGNVRELEHAVERAVLMSNAAQITRADLALETPAQSSIEEMSIEDVEVLLIRKALARFDGNVSRAAELLGLSRSALYRRIQRYSL
ncbi:MAG TPA: sigma-54 dependent transcriptional regulator [Thermoanaerobaculia bacterium]|nr:sigma-54 dependent transcriptional regulator [Thermoanaerobaculia bacterium]